MTAIPWKSAPRSPATMNDAISNVAVVQVSRLELKHLRHVPGFIFAALRLRRNVLRADGALGVSLIAQPFRRTFWTLSAWADADSIGAFTRSEAHCAVMTNYRTKMRGSHFHTWFPGDATNRPSWDDAKARLAKAEHHETR